MGDIPTRRRLVAVHAHPDDECIFTGGTLARYAAEGAGVTLVCCTNGELGEIAPLPELGDPELLRPTLGRVRLSELTESCRHLGVSDVRPLGFHDSGMAGMPENQEPHVFIRQDFGVVIDEVAAVLRDVRPQVVITYNPFGIYGHPDHIRAHEATVAATKLVRAEGVPVAKLYYTVVPLESMLAWHEVLEESERLAGRELDDEDFSEAELRKLACPDSDVTAALDVGAYVDKKFSGLAAHRTQLGTTYRFLDVPAHLRGRIMGTEWYQLVGAATRPREAWERDLFEGVPDAG